MILVHVRKFERRKKHTSAKLNLLVDHKQTTSKFKAKHIEHWISYNIFMKKALHLNVPHFCCVSLVFGS